MTAYIAQRQDACASKGLRLVFDVTEDTPEALLGDARRLVQAIDILLGNAIKFTEQGIIRLTIQRLRQIGAQVVLSVCVADSGIGIAPELHEQIFSPFTQADMSHTRKYGGTGLGLSICRRLALAMGGAIRLESAVGHGSNFYLELPFELDLHNEAPAPTAKQIGNETEAIVKPLIVVSDQSAASSPKCRPGSK